MTAKAIKTDRWYDRHTRCWVVQALDADGYQVGDAIYVYTKREAIEVAGYIVEEVNEKILGS